MAKIKLEIEDTGNATANLILLFNEFLKYADEKAKLNPRGISSLIDVFQESNQKKDT